MLYRYTTSGFTDTFDYPYYFFYRHSVGSTVYENRYYTTEKFRVDYRQDNKVAISFRYGWVGRRMTYYLRVYRNGILVDEETASASTMIIGPVKNFEILDANYYVTLLDGVTVVYTPQSLARFERPQLHVYRGNKLKRKRILYRYSAAEERLIPTP